VWLGDLHRPDRGWEVGPRTHPIPDLVEVVPQIGLELIETLPVHSRRALVGLDPPPRLPHHRLGDRKRLVFGLWHVRSLPPEAHAPVDRLDIPDQPAPWLHHHPSEQRFRSYYGPVRQQAPRLVLNTSGFRRRHAPSRDLKGLRPRSTISTLAFSRSVPEPGPGSRRLHAGHHLASHRDARQAHHERTTRPPAFDATSITLTTLHQRTPAPDTRTGRFLDRLPGPHLTRSSAPSPCRSPRRSSANAAQGGLTPPPEGRRRRATKPPSPAQHRL
jgi:hypothetical protein